ncbi:MAG: hypothetical protein JXB30_03875 [Anaerolineae bacterium]|nr:hypothetical protein [Anaerolineae bacterium]
MAKIITVKHSPYLISYKRLLDFLQGFAPDPMRIEAVPYEDLLRIL